jgi:phage replication O-like protein O
MSNRNRDAYADVGRAMRESIERALAANLTGRDFRVLLALHHRLSSWSRLSDRVYTAEFCQLSGMKENKVRESVARLVEAGAIGRDPSSGRHPSTYRLPTPSAGRVGSNEPAPRLGSVDGSTLPADGASTVPVDGVSTEKDRGEISSSSARRHGAQEPAAFATLLDGIALHGPGRVELLDHWRDAPERVEAVVGEWRERDKAGPGLLVLMVRDGHDPRDFDDGVPF